MGSVLVRREMCYTDLCLGLCQFEGTAQAQAVDEIIAREMRYNRGKSLEEVTP